jgi:hypothetical protein
MRVQEDEVALGLATRPIEPDDTVTRFSLFMFMPVRELSGPLLPLPV